MQATSSSSDVDVVKAYYAQLFCQPCAVNLESRVDGIVAKDWECSPEPIGGVGSVGLADTIRFFESFAPDLSYEPQEILEAGNGKIVVRSIVTGTPTKPLMGVQPTKAFRINAVDIHEVVAGKIARTFRVEDWARAVNQIKA